MKQVDHAPRRCQTGFVPNTKVAMPGQKQRLGRRSCLTSTGRGRWLGTRGKGEKICFYQHKGDHMSISLIVLILLILLLVGALPTWGHSRSWGYGPSGGLGLVVLILLVLLLMGKI
jgi:hypothetical protein